MYRSYGKKKKKQISEVQMKNNNSHPIQTTWMDLLPECILVSHLGLNNNKDT